MVYTESVLANAVCVTASMGALWAAVGFKYVMALYPTVDSVSTSTAPPARTARRRVEACLMAFTMRVVPWNKLERN